MRRRSYMVPRGVCGAWGAGVSGVFNGTGRWLYGGVSERGRCHILVVWGWIYAPG